MNDNMLDVITKTTMNIFAQTTPEVQEAKQLYTDKINDDKLSEREHCHFADKYQDLVNTEQICSLISKVGTMCFFGFCLVYSGKIKK